MQELDDLLKSRKKQNFLDSVVLAYVPEGNLEQEELFQSLIMNFQFDDMLNNILISYGTPFLNIVKVTDRATAEILGLISENNEFSILRVRDCRGWFHAKKPRSAYVDGETLRKYIEKNLKEEFKVNGHTMQLDLKIYFDKFVLGETKDPINKKFTQMDELAHDLARIDPLICPLWSVKDIQMITPKLSQFIASSKKTKILVVSINKDHDERDLSELQTVMQQLKVEEFARTHKDILVLVGNPETIYHVPIRDMSIYHYQPIEIRLFTVSDNSVEKSAVLEDGMTLDDLLKVEEPYFEKSPPKVEQVADVLGREEIYEKVLKNNDKCYFIMNCSKNCPACTYQDPYFQLAAKHSKRCTFAKYYVSNQNPHFKAPNATPTYQLYVPAQKDPIIYDPRKHGLTPEKFLGFIDSELDKISS